MAAIAFGIAAPFFRETWELVAFALIGLAFGVLARLGRLLFFALLAAGIGWLTYSGLSYIWHRDPSRFAHFAREQFLRAFPLFVSGMVLLMTTTVVQFEAALRAFRVPRFLRVPVETMLATGPRLEAMWKERVAAANLGPSWWARVKATPRLLEELVFSAFDSAAAKPASDQAHPPDPPTDLPELRFRVGDAVAMVLIVGMVVWAVVG